MKFARSIATIAGAAMLCAAFGAAAPGTAQASEYEQPTATSDVAATWTPNLVEVNGEPRPIAYAITPAGSQMVVGGRFAAVENSKRKVQYNRSNVFAFDASTGAINTDFAPQVDAPVWAAVSDGTSVYIGGNFKTVNGQNRPALAKLSLATGQLDPAFQPVFKGARVSDLELVNGHLIVSGSFKQRLTSLNPATGKSDKYITDTIAGKLPNSDAAQVFKFDVSPNGEHLVAVGNFLTVNGLDRPRVFMLDLGTSKATLSPWNYEPLARQCSSGRKNAQAYVLDVDFSPDSSWFAFATFGYMYQPGQRGLMLCDAAARFETDNLNPTQPTWINYTGGDSLKSIEVTGSTVYVQGHSRWLDNPYGQDSAGPGSVPRLGGGAIDGTTGMAVTDWNPINGMSQKSGGYDITATANGVWWATDGKFFGGKYRLGIRFTPLP